MKQLHQFLSQLSWMGFIRLLFHPFFLLITTPVRCFQALYSLRCLASEPWGRFARMSAHRSLNSSWHRAYDLLMERYGRFGYAYDISLGWNLATQFSLTKFSMRLYRHNEVVIPWLGVLIMALSQLVWLGENDLVPWIVSAAIIMGLFSTLFYFGAFEALKYDSLGWALVPLGYHALLTGNLWWFALLFLGITFLSVSVTVVQGAVWFFVGLLTQGPLMLTALVPGGLKFLSHFRFVFQRKEFTSIRTISAAIGLSSSGAKVRRLRLGIAGAYLLGLWGVSWTTLWFLAEPSSILSRSEQLALTGLPILLYLINKRFRRFTDQQTIYMLVFCAFSVVTLHQPDGLLLPVLWLALSPMPLFLGFSDEAGSANLIWQVPRRQPYRIGPVRDFATAFMKPVKQRDRVLFEFDYDPTQYPNFDGLRGIKEFLHYLALEREAVIVPDFYLVFDSYADRFPLADSYRDNSPQGRWEAMSQIGARFLILPVASPELSPEWTGAGFALRSCMDLAEGEGLGLWSKNSYREERPYLLLLEALDLQTDLTVCGTMLEMLPNHLRLQLNDKGEAIVRLLYSDGWRSCSRAIVGSSPGSMPWIRVRGDANAVVELHFDYFEERS